MSKNVFFAWQLDTEVNDNKTFIWDSITSACQNLDNGSNPELSPRPEKDTEEKGTDLFLVKLLSCRRVLFISLTQYKK